jgi:putative ABC transport system permease protein
MGLERGQIVSMVVRHGALLASAGAVIGIAASLLIGRVLGSLLYGIKATDAVSFVAASSVLLRVALAASFIPARRASKVDPMVALSRSPHHFRGAIIFVTRPTLVSPAYRLSCLSNTQ